MDAGSPLSNRPRVALESDSRRPRAGYPSERQGVNAEGVGARVEVEAPGLPRQVRELFPGGTTWGYGDSQLLFGVGGAPHVTVTVDWRPAGGTVVQTVEATPGSLLIEERQGVK